MSATQFKVDLEDIRFVLFDQLDIHTELAGLSRYADFDRDIYESMLEEARRISEEVIAPINGPGDRQGCKLDAEGNVTTPEGYRQAWQIAGEGGWIGVSAPAEAGGAGLPHVIGMVVSETFSGAGMAFTMYIGLTQGVGRVIAQFGPPGRREEYSAKLFSGEWAGTMCLTEAGAGTAVGDNRCKANRTDEPGTYLLEGEKIFISGGDHDLAENILHLVLARTPDAPTGSKGLSLFIVPKFIPKDDLSNGERNGAHVVGIEHKMGINGSSTCTLALGARGPCTAWIVGEEGQGLEIMFHLMNEARIGVGIQGLALAAAGYNYSVAYARDRIQGTAIENFKDADAPRVAIIEHPDVRRMLMTQKVWVETMRSLVYRLGQRLDVAENTEDEAERERLMGQVELLVPVVKAHCTDLGFQSTVVALQVFGGYGYIGEYPVEQLVRDGKITSIYEGTNGVQAIDLLGRKMRMKGGALFMSWMQDVQQDLATATGEGFGAQAEALGKALNHVGATAMHLGMLGGQGKLKQAMLEAYPFLQMLGTVALGVEALLQARIAKRLIAERGETPHLAGKLLNLDFYVKNLLPQAIAIGRGVQAGDDSCLDERLFQ